MTALGSKRWTHQCDCSNHFATGILSPFFSCKEHFWSYCTGASTVELVHQLGYNLESKQETRKWTPCLFLRFCSTNIIILYDFSQMGSSIGPATFRKKSLSRLWIASQNLKPKGQVSRNVMEAFQRCLFRESWVEQKNLMNFCWVHLKAHELSIQHVCKNAERPANLFSIWQSPWGFVFLAVVTFLDLYDIDNTDQNL